MTVFSAKLSEPTLSALPGGVVGCDLRVRNAGDAAVAVRIEPRGRAGAWAVALPATVGVAPGGEAQARLTFTVPDAPFVAGETVAFTVRVVGDQSLDVPGAIEIAERRDVRLSVLPLISRDARCGRHTVEVANRGNVPALVTLGADDEGGGTAVALSARVVVVEPGESARVALVVTARRRLFGRRPRPHRVSVWADQDDGPRLGTAAVLFQSPVRWKRAVALAAVAAGLAVVLAVAGLGRAPVPLSPEVAAAPGGVEVPSNCREDGDDALVPIAAFAFCPATLTVAAGSEVRWRNDDLAAHSATADGLFDTGVLRTGQSAGIRFDWPGTYPYYCVLHPGMRGTVVVTA